jgi:tetratricopeptide (TPR) repeat protein
MKYIIITGILICLNLLFSNEKSKNLTKAEQLSAQGIELLNQGNYDQAIDIFKQAIKLDSQSIFYPYEIALAFYEKKEFKKAIEILDSLRNHPQVNDQVYQLLGNCHHFIDNSDKAIMIYDEGLQKFPNSGRLFMESGIARIGKKRVREVIGYWEKGIEVEPAFESNYYYLAKYYARTGEKLWTVLYGEIYLNIASNTKRRDEISKLVYDTYNLALFSPEDSLFKVSFSDINVVSDSSDKKNIPFEMAFQQTIYEASKPYFLLKTSTLAIDDIIKIRHNFILLWYKKNYNKQFPNIIFDWQKLNADHGNFEAYNYWLLDMGNLSDFNKWLDSNRDKFNKFIKKLRLNPMKLDSNNRFSRFKYN